MTPDFSKTNWKNHQILKQKPTKVFLSLGSNLGDREQSLERAIECLQVRDENQILHLSSLYETEPVDCLTGGWFLNQVIQLVTLFSPKQLLDQLQALERRLGRVKQEINGPREIDIDILFFGDEIIAEPHLQIPHPRLHERRFVLEPLNELNPQIWHPLYNKTVQTLLTEAPEATVQRVAPALIN